MQKRTEEKSKPLAWVTTGKAPSEKVKREELCGEPRGCRMWRDPAWRVRDS